MSMLVQKISNQISAWDVQKTAKSLLVNCREPFHEMMDLGSLVGTMAYLAKEISPDTYKTILLADLAVSATFMIADAAFCYTAPEIPSISAEEAEKKAEELQKKNLLQLVAEQDMTLYFRLMLEQNSSKLFGEWPSAEKLKELGKVGQAVEFAKFGAQTTWKVYCSALKAICYRNRFFSFWTGEIGAHWTLPLLKVGIKVATDAFTANTRKAEMPQDLEILKNWMDKLMHPPAILEERLQLIRDLPEILSPILNRVYLCDQRLGEQLAAGFFFQLQLLNLQTQELQTA